MKKVQTGKLYRYEPVGLDLFDSRAPEIQRGDIVEVVKLPGCPPPNTLGHCHILKHGKFAGLVLTNSLEDIKLEEVY